VALVPSRQELYGNCSALKRPITVGESSLFCTCVLYCVSLIVPPALVQSILDLLICPCEIADSWCYSHVCVSVSVNINEGEIKQLKWLQMCVLLTCSEFVERRSELFACTILPSVGYWRLCKFLKRSSLITDNKNGAFLPQANWRSVLALICAGNITQ